MCTSRAVAEQACRIVLRRMQDHLGACGGVDEKCDVGDGDERSPHDPDERGAPSPSPRRSIRMNDRERDRERVYSHAGALAGTGEVVLRGRRGHSLIAPTPPRRPACHRFGAAEKGEGGGVSWGPSAPGGEFSG